MRKCRVHSQIKEEHPDGRLAMATARTSSPDVSACNNRGARLISTVVRGQRCREVPQHVSPRRSTERHKNAVIAHLSVTGFGSNEEEVDRLFRMVCEATLSEQWSGR